MPSMEHELLVAIIRDHPEVVIDLLGAAFGLSYPEDVEVLASAENLTGVQPTERRADVLLVVRQRNHTRPISALIIEVQLRPDPEKWWTWPDYLGAARSRLRCPVAIVAIALDARTAAWCSEPIDLDGLKSAVWPLVIGPALVPIVDARSARTNPDLAVVSLLAHRNEPVAIDLSRAILGACADLDPARAELYADLAFGLLGEAARRALEAEMKLESYVPKNEFLEGLRAAARSSGHAEGLAEGRAHAVLDVLDTRGLAVTDTQREVIVACVDEELLAQWLRRAVVVASTAELFAG
jgi:hypothetical protein